MKSKSCFSSWERKPILLLIAFVLCLFTQLNATVITVCSTGCGFTTIAAAMTAAASGDTIRLNVNGMHTEKNITVPEKNLVLVGLGKGLTTLQSAAARADAVNGGRIFTRPVPSGAGGNYLILEDMTIRYAYAPLVNSSANGGVLYASGTLKGMITKFNRVRFYANETAPGNSNSSGGACVYISSGGSTLPYNATVDVNDCDFDENRLGSPTGTSLSDGACFSLYGGNATLTINNCTFTSNNAASRGGVIYVGSNWILKISNSVFASNTSRNGDGGCFHARSGTWTFENCLFKNNSAVFVSVGNGTNGYGGVYFGGGTTFKNCTFFSNSAVTGGAITRVNNNTLDMQLLNCTFYGNSASSKGKSLYFGSPPPSTPSSNVLPLRIVNTIFANGGGLAANEIHFNYTYNNFATNIRNYCNSIGNDAATPGTTPTFDFTSANTPALGLSSTLSSSGGAMESLSLSASSPMVNAGTSMGGTGYSIPIKDQRNYSRNDLGIDVGSFEYNGIADNSDVPGISYTALGNTLSTANRTLQATITDANGVYWFDSNIPRIYFKKGAGGTWFSTAGVLSSGNGISGTWNFTINNSLIGGVEPNDQVFYFIIASDVSSSARISSSPTGAAAMDVNTITSAPSSPDSYTISSVLPVTLLSFTGTTKENDVILTWKVTDVVDFSHFEIERSTEHSSFIKVGQRASINGFGDQQYKFIDPSVFLHSLAGGALNYRLKLVDKDHTFRYSQVVRVIPVAGKHKFLISILPNPFADKMNINLSANKKEVVTFRLLDINGNLVRKTQQVIQPGFSSQSLNNLSGLKSGVYILEILRGNEITSEKIIKR